MRRTGSSQTR